MEVTRSNKQAYYSTELVTAVKFLYYRPQNFKNAFFDEIFLHDTQLRSFYAQVKTPRLKSGAYTIKSLVWLSLQKSALLTLRSLSHTANLFVTRPVA